MHATGSLLRVPTVLDASITILRSRPKEMSALQTVVPPFNNTSSDDYESVRATLGQPVVIG
jgi:hypothetical protein